VFAIGQSRSIGAALASSLLASALVLAGCTGKEEPRSAARNMDASVRYVGGQACQPCHSDIARSFASTGMGRSLYTLQPGTDVEDFSRNNRLEVASERVVYEMLARGDDRVIRLSALDDDGRPLASAERKIDYVIGSGNHSRSYVTSDGSGLYQMPVCWYPDKPGWDLCPGYELNHEHFGRQIEPSCLFCHDARVALVAGTENRYAEPIPHGIDCERCHGPGELHVARWSGATPGNPPASDDTIVNPAALPKGRRIQVCLQCHMGDSDAGARVQKPGRDLTDFRPGQHIGDYIDAVSFDPPMENRFGLGSQGDRLMLSRCYKESGGAVDCLTCHDPHVSVYDAGRPADHFRKACLTCHTEKSCRLEETERRARSASDDCVSCHMRRSDPADQRFTAFTDHWIRRRIDPPGPPPARVASRNLSILPVEGARSSGATSSFILGVGYFLKKLDSANAALIPWSEPESRLREVVNAEPDLAEGWHMLGTLALKQGHVSEAIGDFREALRLDPAHARARMRLASALLVQGRPGEAIPLLRRALEENPSDIAAMSELSRALVETGEDGEAEEALARALAISPGHPTLLANQGLLSARRGRHEEAVEELRRAGALEPGAAEVWDALASSLLELGRTREASGAAGRAVFLRPTMPAAQYHLGVALAAEGRIGEAEKALRMAVTLRPGYGDAIAALRKLPAEATRARRPGSPPPPRRDARSEGATLPRAGRTPSAGR